MGGWVFLTRIASASSAVRFPGPSFACDFLAGCMQEGVFYRQLIIWALFLRLSLLSESRFSCANCFWEWWEGEFFRPEGGRRKDGGGSGESRVTRSILPPVTKIVAARGASPRLLQVFCFFRDAHNIAFV